MTRDSPRSYGVFGFCAQDPPALPQPPASNDVMSLDPDTMDEDSFREGLELMEQLEVRACCDSPGSYCNFCAYSCCVTMQCVLITSLGSWAVEWVFILRLSS